MAISFYNQGILADNLGTSPDVLVGGAAIANMQLILFAMAGINIVVSIIFFSKYTIKQNKKLV